MQEMFKNCFGLESIDLSNFDISKVTTMESMFEGDSNLKYINYKFFEEKNDLNTNNMFASTPDDIIYCIIDDENIPLELSQKICSINDCQSNWMENKKNRLSKDKDDIMKDKCVYKSIKDLSNDFFLSNEIANTSIYSYKLDSSTNEILKEKYTNITFFDFSEENIQFIKKYFGLDTNDNIYCIFHFK